MDDSSFGRLVGVLLSPRRTFESIARRPSWAVALVVVVLLAVVAVWSAFVRIEPDSLLRSVAEQSGRELPASMDAESLHTMSMWSGVVGAALFGPIIYLVAAGLFLVALRLSGSDIDFRRTFSVTLHGMMPFAVAALLGIPVALAKDTVTLEEVQGGSLLASNLSLLAGDEASPLVLAVLSSVDLFSIWCIVLLVIGFGAVGRVSRAAAAASVGVVWLLGVALKVAMAALR